MPTSLPVSLRLQDLDTRQSPTTRSRWQWPIETDARRCFLLAVLCCMLFFYGLGSGQLWRTESLRAIIAQEFLRSGNWIVPTLYGEPLFSKPPGMYAAIALVSWPLGSVHAWTARLPSALAATATVFMFYFYLRRFWGGRYALMAAAILPTSPLWLDKATSAEIDMLQVFWVTGAVLCFLRALETEESWLGRPDMTLLGHSVAWAGRSGLLVDDFTWVELPEPHGSMVSDRSQQPLTTHKVSPGPKWGSAGWWWMAALLCLAGGVLTKWTAPAFFYLTVISLLWRRRRLHLLWSRRHVLSVCVAGSLCLAWAAAAAGQAGWGPIWQTVSKEAYLRLVPGSNSRSYPWGQVLSHPIRLLACALPWSCFALLTLRAGFNRLWDARGRFLLQAFHAWTWPSLIFWTLVAEHSPRQSFPLFPGIAGLAAFFFLAWIQGRVTGPVRWKPVPVLVTLVLGWVCVKVAFVQAAQPLRDRERMPAEKGELLAELVPSEQTLYLFRLKDEGIMFYYGRPARRLRSPAELPLQQEPVYCILDRDEWAAWQTEEHVQLLSRLEDEQRAPIYLVRRSRAAPAPH